MTRKLQLIGIVLAAVVASSVLASAAEAGEFEVEAGAGGTVSVKGEPGMKPTFTNTPGKWNARAGLLLAVSRIAPEHCS